jgi:hypothetical protein
VTTNPQSEPILGTASGFDVDISALAAHHQQLGVVVDQLADALRTALDTHLPEEAFGPFGAPLAAAIKPTAETAQGAFHRAVEAVLADRDGVDRTVRAYDDLERANAGLLRMRESA